MDDQMRKEFNEEWDSLTLHPILRPKKIALCVKALAMVFFAVGWGRGVASMFEDSKQKLANTGYVPRKGPGVTFINPSPGDGVVMSNIGNILKKRKQKGG